MKVYILKPEIGGSFFFSSLVSLSYIVYWNAEVFTVKIIYITEYYKWNTQKSLEHGNAYSTAFISWSCRVNFFSDAEIE